MRLGLGARWKCLFANDISEKKAASYRANFPPSNELHVADIKGVAPSSLPGRADMAWASFPCQDLSLAGAGAGLQGERSGTFWTFWKILRSLGEEGRQPTIVVLENVPGAVKSHGGRDFLEIIRVLNQVGYRVGAMIVDASLFLPQSRPRLILIAVSCDYEFPATLTDNPFSRPWHTRAICEAFFALSPHYRQRWVWWRLPLPPSRSNSVDSLIEDPPIGVTWYSPNETEKLLAQMTPVNLAKVAHALSYQERKVGLVYRRTRVLPDGTRNQRAEVRFDGVSGCLRTPGGGSSRQIVLIVENGVVRSRLLTAREAARLMGLPEKYKLPNNYNEAYHLVGDGVAVPVVSWLERHILAPLLSREITTHAAL